MSKLPVISGENLIKLLVKTGFYIDRIKGSHFVLKTKTIPVKTVVVPLHPELDKGTLISVLKQANLTREEFIFLFNNS